MSKLHRSDSADDEFYDDYDEGEERDMTPSVSLPALDPEYARSSYERAAVGSREDSADSYGAPAGGKRKLAPLR